MPWDMGKQVLTYGAPAFPYMQSSDKLTQGGADNNILRDQRNRPIWHN